MPVSKNKVTVIKNGKHIDVSEVKELNTVVKVRVDRRGTGEFVGFVAQKNDMFCIGTGLLSSLGSQKKLSDLIRDYPEFEFFLES